VDEVNLDTEFTLAVGQTATVAGENLGTKFVEVVSDSRCPKGATCIWAGEASCLIELTASDATLSKVLTQPGPSSPSTATVAGYDIAFDILPYPELGKQIAAKDYRLQMVVSKTPA
jgi:murein endopeptidase